MASMNKLEKLERASSLSVSLAVAVVTLTLSSLYWVNGTELLSVTIFPQFAIFAILGFFHAYNIWELENVITKKQSGMLPLVVYFLLYTAWYNAVLLPESGLGYMEWILVLLVLTSNFMTEISGKKINNPFMGQRPMVLLFFGVLLFFCKQIIFYLFEGNLYDQFILGNSTGHLFIGLFSVFGVFLLVKQLGKHVSNRIPLKISAGKLTSLKESFFSFVKSGAQAVSALVMSLFTGPALIAVIIIGILVALLSGLWGVVFLKKLLYDNIVNIVNPLLERLATTGENNKLVPSVPYYVAQLLSLVTVLIHTVSIESGMKKKMKLSIEKEIRMVTDEIQPAELSEEKFQEARQMLVNGNFDEQLRINGNRKIVAEIVNNQ